MRANPSFMKPLRTFTAASFAALILTVTAFAADPSGSWKWTNTRPGGQTSETTAKLQEKEGKLTGTVSSPMGETAISDGTFAADSVKFTVERERNGNKFVIKYEGKVEGDAIKGTILMPGRDGGEPRKVDWNATRVK